MRQTHKEIYFYIAISNTDKVRNLDYKNEKIIEDLAWAWKSLRQTLTNANYKPQKASSSFICVPKNLHNQTLQVKQPTRKNSKIQKFNQISKEYEKEPSVNSSKTVTIQKASSRKCLL